MAKKISELAAATTPLAGTELVEIVQDGVNKKVAAAALGGGGAAALFAPVVTDATTARISVITDAGSYLRFTSGAAATYTVQPQTDVSWANDSEIHVRRASATNLTLTPGSGVTLNAPSGGTLVLTNNMSVTLKLVSSDVWDVIGQTVPV